MNNIRKTLQTAAIGAVAFNSLIMGGVAFGADIQASPLKVQQFRYLDKELDRISLEQAGAPDGIRDGHLQLLIDAGEGTEIKSITMKAADSKGSDTGGTWTTWKEPSDIGKYLLAIEHDGKTINNTFMQSLGTFKGINQFDLYASDNNSMKEGEYYYLEIATSGGIVKSEVTPFVDADTSYAPVLIREFSWVDLKQDKIGSAAFGDDGSTDGHFKLKLAFAQKTKVLSVILRPTDEEGKEVSAGIWRTNRAGVGWLLGLVQGDKIINPEFNKDETAPVGSFRGTVALDLYANNNGSIKNGQHYVIEVETQFGTVKSKPIEFGKAGSIYKDDTVFPFKTISLKLNSKEAAVDEKNVKLDVAPFSLDKRTMVPLRFISEAFGSKVGWDKKTGLITISKGNSKIELVIDKKQAVVNGKTVQLDSPAIVRNNVTLVPIRFVSESLNMKVFFDEGEIFVTDAKEQ